MPTKITWKIQASFILYFNFEVLLWKVIRNSYQFFYFLFYNSFNISRYHFSKLFTTSFNVKHYLKKIFVVNFPFFNRFIQLPTLDPLNGQSPLSVTKNLSIPQFSLRCPLKQIFFKNLLTKSSKSIFYVPAVNCHCHCIFKGSITIDSLIFFSEYIFQEQLFCYFGTGFSNYLW